MSLSDAKMTSLSDQLEADRVAEKAEREKELAIEAEKKAKRSKSSKKEDK